MTREQIMSYRPADCFNSVVEAEMVAAFRLRMLGELSRMNDEAMASARIKDMGQ